MTFVAGKDHAIPAHEIAKAPLSCHLYSVVVDQARQRAKQQNMIRRTFGIRI